MPLFEYHCLDCHHDFELLVREQTVLACPSCQSRALEKQLSVFAVSTATDAGRPSARAAGPGPCGSCGHPDGPGSCSVN